jgi:hypothetical protein
VVAIVSIEKKAPFVTGTDSDRVPSFVREPEEEVEEVSGQVNPSEAYLKTPPASADNATPADAVATSFSPGAKGPSARAVTVRKYGRVTSIVPTPCPDRKGPLLKSSAKSRAELTL